MTCPDDDQPPTVEVIGPDGKVEQRAAYVDTGEFELRNLLSKKHHRMPRLKPVVRAGENLLETIDGRFVVVRGLLPPVDLPSEDEQRFNGGW